MTPRTIPVKGGRTDAPAQITHSRGNPLTFRVTLETASMPVNGATFIRAEIRRSQVDTLSPLATAQITTPTGNGPFDLPFSGPQLNFDLSGIKDYTFWLVIYVLYADGGRDTIYRAYFKITEDGATYSEAAPPVVDLLLTLSVAENVFSTIAALGEETAARAELAEGVELLTDRVTTAEGGLTEEATARASADTALATLADTIAANLATETATRTQLITALSALVTALQQGQAGGRVTYQTLAELNADLAHPANTPGEVTNDGTLANIGNYIKVGGTGTGSWLKSTSDVPARLYTQELNTATMRVVSGLFLAGVEQALSLLAQDDTSPFTVGTDSVIRMAKVIIDGGTAALQSLAVAGVSMITTETAPGWLFLLQALDEKNLLGIKDTGEIIAPGLVLPTPPAGWLPTAAIQDDGVTPAKLSLALRRDTALDYAPALPDDVRGQLVTIGAWYNNQWQSFPRQVTPILFGLNNSGNTVDFRPACGLLIRGNRKVGTYSPGAIPSQVYKAELRSSTTWPPAGTFVGGDYYAYTSTGSRVIGSDTVRLGDLMVYDGAGWVYQAAPGSGVARLPMDWWTVSADGTFNGVAYKTDDRIVYLGYQSESGVGFELWRKGNTADNGEFFRCGTFAPSGGYPATAVDGDTYLANAAGTVPGGLTFAIGDTLFRWGGTWGKIPSGPIQSFASGALIHLPCVNNAGEWEVRRGDGGTTLIPITLNGRGTATRYRSTSGILVAADSMGMGPGSTLATLMTGRTVTVKSWGGGTSRNILSAVENLMLTSDANRGDAVVTFCGQNSAGFTGQNFYVRRRIMELMGAGDMRVLHVSMLGQRDFTFDGTRLVCANFEQQRVAGSSNTYARDVAMLRATYPDQWLWAAKTLCDAAANDTEPSIQFPGKTNAEVAALYGIPPLKWCRLYNGSGAFDMTGIVLGSLNFLGYHSAAGLPAGGNNQDYYLRTGNGVIGEILIKIAGTWVTRLWDPVHLSPAGDAVQGAAVAAFFNSKNW